MHPSRRLCAVLALLLASQAFASCRGGMKAAEVAPAPSPPAEATPAEATDEAGATAPQAPEEAGAPEATDEADEPEATDEAGAPEATDEADADEAQAAPAVDCVSSKCHVDILAKKNVHDAAEGCTDCHEELSGPHPGDGSSPPGLLQEMPDLCSTCHDEYGQKKTVHMPVGDGSCTDCHDPHSSDEDALLIAPVAEVCAECHEAGVDEAVPHGPVADGDCLACHVPHESDTAALLTMEGPALCIDCHSGMEDVMQKKVVHAPLEDGCLDCHSPHGSKFPALLAAEGADACFECHDGIATEIDEASEPHAAMDDEAGCMLCHDPHSSDQAGLLAKPIREVCMECHDDVGSASATVFHGKDGSGDCADCHTPHGGSVEGLLAGEYPEGNYQAWSDSAYPLCFRCHERDLVDAAETKEATGFRDGKQNLHTVHVDDGEKGRSCSFCHDVHGTASPKLVRDSVAFGKWKLSLKFLATPTGGGCAPGCHKPLWYDRDLPGRRPATGRG